MLKESRSNLRSSVGVSFDDEAKLEVAGWGLELGVEVALEGGT